MYFFYIKFNSIGSDRDYIGRCGGRREGLIVRKKMRSSWNGEEKENEEDISTFIHVT